jgi:hypothetical protein
MSDDEQILAIFVNGIAYITGSTKAAQWVRLKIIERKRYIWFLSILIWSIILYTLIW